MRSFILYILFVFFATALQGSLFFQDARPDLVLLIVIFYALRKGETAGLYFGALAGLFLDIAGGGLLGPNSLSKALTGFCVPLIRKKLFQWNIIANTMSVVFFSCADIVLVAACYSVFTGAAFLNKPVYMALRQALYTVAAGAVLYFPFRPDSRQRAIPAPRF